MVSGGKTTLCDYSVLFSSVIYREKMARSDFGEETSWSSGEWDETTATISVMRLNANGCTWCVCIPIFLSSFLLLPPYNPLLLSIYLSNSPLKQINCLRPPRPANTTNGISRKAFLLNIGRPSGRPIRCVTLYRPAHRADRVTSNGNSI